VALSAEAATHGCRAKISAASIHAGFNSPGRPAGTAVCSGMGTLNASQHCVEGADFAGSPSWQQTCPDFSTGVNAANAQWFDASNHAKAATNVIAVAKLRALRSGFTVVT
jgi:hypothetical protein